MTRRYIPLKSLRAFEAAARHLSFTHAAIELNVTHSAVSQQVKLLEDQLRCPLFLRIPRGLMLTPEGEHLLPVLNESFDRIAQLLDYFAGRKVREKLKIGVVGTFATGFLLPRLNAFEQTFPHILNCRFPPTITGWMWRQKDWTMPSGLAVAPGMVRLRSIYATARSPHYAHHRSPPS